MLRLLSALALLALGQVAAKAETIRHCLLEVQGTRFISGPCDFSPNGEGDFIITKGNYFAYVFVSPETNSYWNGSPPESHAHDSLGILKRNKGCWENEHARVCANR